MKGCDFDCLAAGALIGLLAEWYLVRPAVRLVFNWWHALEKKP